MLPQLSVVAAPCHTLFEVGHSHQLYMIHLLAGGHPPHLCLDFPLQAIEQLAVHDTRILNTESTSPGFLAP